MKNVYEYIRIDSIKNAQKVVSEIIPITRSLSAHPEKFPLDKSKDNNDGSYRFFEKHRLRVAYRILPDKIRILRVRSAKQEPLDY